MIGFLAAAAVGAGVGIYGRMNELDQARDQMKLLESQRKYIWKEYGENKALLNTKAENVGIQNTEQSRASAIAAFQNKSGATSQASQSGIASGSPFYKSALDYKNNLDTIRSQDRIAASETKSIVHESNLLDIGRDRQLEGLNAQIDSIDKQIDYMNSPLSWGMTIASGAMNGVSMASSAMSAYKEIAGHQGAAGGYTSADIVETASSVKAPDSPNLTTFAQGSFNSNLLTTEDDFLQLDKNLFKPYGSMFNY